MSSNVNTHRRMWLIAVEGALANLLFGSMLVWSVLRNPLLELFPTWTEGMLSAIFGIHNLFTCIGILLGGWLRKRLPSRRVFIIFVTLAVSGMLGFSLLPVHMPKLSYVMAFTFFCVFSATGVGIGINVVQSTTIPWFPNNSGAISGVLYMALGLSSFLLAALARTLLPIVGVKYILPVFGLMILTVGVAILLDKNSITVPDIADDATTAEGLRPREMLRSSGFWILILWNIGLRTAGLILLDHAASLAVAFGGFALTAMLISPANGLGCLSGGIAMDKLGITRIMKLAALVMLLSGILLTSGTLTGSFAMIFAGLLLGGLSYGCSSSSYAASVKNTFGTKHYAQNFAISNLAIGCAALLESTSGSVLDISGSYVSVMCMVLTLAGIAAVLSIFSGKTILK